MSATRRSSQRTQKESNGSDSSSPADNNTASSSTRSANKLQQRITNHFTSTNGRPVPSPAKPTSARRSSRRGSVKKEEVEDGTEEANESSAVVKAELSMKVENGDEKTSVKDEEAVDETTTPVKRGRGGRRAPVKQEQSGQSDNSSRGSRKRGRAVKEESVSGEVDEENSAATGSAYKEGGEADDDDNEWEGVKDSVETQLTYEQQRQANIRRNLEQMQLLQLSSILPPSLSSSSSSSSAGKRKKLPTVSQRQRTIPTRRSLRNQGLDPEGNEAIIQEGEGRYVPELTQWMRPSRREGSIPMIDIKVEVRGSYNVKGEEKDEIEIADEDDEQSDEKDEAKQSSGSPAKPTRDPTIDGLCATFKALAPTTSNSNNSKRRATKPASITPLTPDVILRIQPLGMTNKLVRKRCTTLAYHPSSTTARSILVAGDKTGEMGVLCYGEVGRMREEGESIQCAFSVHDGGINSFCFNDRYEYCYSASNDGTIRQLSFDYQQYLESYVNDDELSILTVTSNAHHPNSLFACDRKGDLIVLDTSSSSLTVSSRTSLSHIKVNCVTVHPAGHLLASCGNDRTVRLWDLRQLKDDTPLHTFEHGYSVNSVYFSPSGGRLLSTCIDDYVRVWEVGGDEVSEWTECVRVRHNNQTGRWVTLFKAKWTMTDDAFLIGNMSRQVDLYAWEGEGSGGSGGGGKGGVGSLVQPQLYGMTSSELTAIPSAVAVHPSNEYFIGATASGYAYLWGL